MSFFEKIGMSVFVMPFILLIGYIVMLYSYLSFGYVIEITWKWFIPNDLTIFIPTYWQSVGIYFMIKVLMGGSTVKKAEYLKKYMYESKNYMIGCVLSFISPWTLLLAGYVVKNHFFFW